MKESDEVIVSHTKFYSDDENVKVWSIVDAKPAYQGKKQQKDEFYASRKVKTISYDDYFEMSELQQAFEDELSEDIRQETIRENLGFASSPVKVELIKQVKVEAVEKKTIPVSEHDKSEFTGNSVICQKEELKQSEYEVEGFEEAK